MKPIPTTVEIFNNLKNDFISRLNLTTTFLKTVLNAMSAVLAAKFKLLYNYLADVQNNMFPDTADSESVGGTLQRWGRLFLGRDPFPATPGIFMLAVTGNAGATLRLGITFKSNEDSLNPGQLYVLDSAYTLTGTGDIVQARSLGGGSSFNLDIGDNLTITEPVLGVEQTVTVDSVTTQPTDAEDLEDYRQAVLDALQLEPQGGAKTDYRLWASDAAGVRTVYPYVRNSNAGIVDVYVEANLSDSTDGYGTPSGALLTEVGEVIEFDSDETKPLNERGRRPIQAIPETQPIATIPVDVLITGLNQTSPSIESAISSNMETYLYTVRPFIAGADLLRNRNDVLYEAKLQAVVTDVMDNGNYFTGFQMSVNGVSVDTYTFDLGNIPYLRNVNYA